MPVPEAIARDSLLERLREEAAEALDLSPEELEEKDLSELEELLELPNESIDRPTGTIGGLPSDDFYKAESRERVNHRKRVYKALREKLGFD